MDERKQHWESVYQQKSADEVSWFQIHPEYSLDLIRAAGVAKNQPVIDVGGGAAHLVDTLLDAGYADVTVLDIAATALEQAKTHLGTRAAQATWLESDVTAFIPPKPYAMWHDRAVFHFLTDAGDRAKYLAVLRRALPAGGHLIIATFAPDGPERCSNLPVERYDADKLQAVLGNEFRLLETRSEEHRTPAGKVQHFLYFRCVREACA
jgi:trans-aconitate methyltransferase